MKTNEFIEIEGVAETLSINVQLLAQIKKEKPGMYVSYCPTLDICSQGSSSKEARQNIIEATQLFIESCFERGTLSRALEKRGFRSVRKSPSPRRSVQPAAVVAAAKTVQIPLQIPLMAHSCI